MCESIRSKVSNFFNFFISVEPKERIKVVYLSIIFFLIVGAYTLAKAVKDSIFVSIVGKSYLPEAKWASMLVLIPFIFIYSRLVDSVRRHQLLYIYSIVYAVGFLLFVYAFSLPGIGLQNTDASPHRILGWLYYFFVEGYTPFLISVFWAFSNSITSPNAAKKNYTIMVAGSKLGGMTTAAIGWWIATYGCSTCGFALSNVASHQIMLSVVVLFVLIVPFMVRLLLVKAPRGSLHGYEAVYQLEKKQAREEEKKGNGFVSFVNEMGGGLKILIQYPYALGIFGMVFFWEITNTIFQYMRLGILKDATSSMSELSAAVMQQDFYTQALGLVFVLIGTRALVEKIGIRYTIITVPLIMGGLVFYSLFAKTAFVVLVVTVSVRAINYALASPVRESLYIPTTKETKFKTKSWIDAFGTKIAKSVGQGYNFVTAGLPMALLFGVHVGFFFALIAAWTGVAFALGRRFDYAVKHNEVIGIPDTAE